MLEAALVQPMVVRTNEVIVADDGDEAQLAGQADVVSAVWVFA